MSNIEQIIEERPHEMGSFLVGRLLPFRTRRMVGPFTFIDHMGPVSLEAHEQFDVPPHPHIGLSTLTYLFEGSIMHRDSLGTEQEIKPHEVNWMTAGRGIVHSERTPAHLRQQPKRLHGLQIWVAMPKTHEQDAPSFFHAKAEQLPGWSEGALTYKLIAGEAMGRVSPVPVYSRLYLIEIKATADTDVAIGEALYGETAMYILEGRVESEGFIHEPKRILVAKEGSLCRFGMAAGTTVYIFGGEPLGEERFIYWNFVASDKALIEQAKQAWESQTFPKIPGETTSVPLPKLK